MIERMESDSAFHALVVIAEADGVSIREVARRGAADLAARLGLIEIRRRKQEKA